MWVPPTLLSFRFFVAGADIAVSRDMRTSCAANATQFPVLRHGGALPSLAQVLCLRVRREFAPLR